MGPAGVVLGQKVPLRRTLHQFDPIGPLHRTGGPLGHRVPVRKGGCGPRLLPALIVPEKGGNLLPGDGILGAEGSILIAADHPVGLGPADGVQIGVVQAHIREGLRRCFVHPRLSLGGFLDILGARSLHLLCGTARQTVQGLGQDGSGQQAIRGKGRAGQTVHQLMLLAECNRSGIPYPLVYILISSVDRPNRGQRRGQRQGCQPCRK